MKKLFGLLVASLYVLTSCSRQDPLVIAPGQIWPDNNGVHVNAHGGGVLLHDGVYYWFGENKCDTTSILPYGDKFIFMADIWRPKP